MAASVAARVYLVTWIGERVVADIRKAVFAQVLRLEPAFFEVTRTGEVISRLTTDTSLLQVVVGSTLAIAVRNALLISGGLVMLTITSGKLALLVLLGVPACGDTAVAARAPGAQPVAQQPGPDCRYRRHDR